MELDLSKYRYQHRYIIGQTGTGKSTTLLNLMIDDINNGDGLLFIDPHGDDSLTLLSHIPKERSGDVIFFDPAKSVCPLNLIGDVPVEQRPFIASSILDTFKSVWGYDDVSTPVFDQFVYNSIAALLETPNTTLLNMYLLLSNSDYRQEIVRNIMDKIVKDFWVGFDELPAKEQREATRSTMNKIGFLMSDPRIRRTLGYSGKSVFDLKDVLRGKILIVRLSQGELGIDKAAMLGSLLLGRIHAACLSREERAPFHIYLDECHHFDIGSLREMLSGIRKFQVSLTLAHQYLDQLSPRLLNAVWGSVGTKVVFRLGQKDAHKLLNTEIGENPAQNSVTSFAAFRARVSAPNIDPKALPDDWDMPPLPEPQPSNVKDKILYNHKRYFTREPATVDAAIDKELKWLV